MKMKYFTLPALLSVLILSLTASPGSALAQKDKDKQKSDVIIIPQDVKSALTQGLQTRQARLDIPFAVSRHLYLPAMQNFHNIFMIKIKNSDLGFIPAVPAGTEEKKEEKAKEKTEESAFESTPAQLQASLHTFLYFKQLDGTYEKDVYIPFKLRAEGSAFDPEQEELYFVGYPLPAGNYVLALAIASPNLAKIGIQYVEFSLPNSASFTQTLETTPIFFCRDIQRMAAAETTAEVHKDFFTYSVLQVKPNIDNVFAAGENLDIFFYIFGVLPDEAQKLDIDVSYEVHRGDEVFIKYAPQKYGFPMVSQPLPMKKTVLIKETDSEGKTTERKETRDLEPGTYTLTLDIKDNVSGKTLKKSVDFEVKAAS